MFVVNTDKLPPINIWWMNLFTY